MATPPAHGLLVVERLLRDRDSVWKQIIEERDLRGLSTQMLISSAVSLAIYGAVLGASNSWQQALSSLVKLPLLFLATLAICLPTLYLFNLVFGARLSMMQAVTLIMVSVTVTSVLTLAFAPISLFFLISAHSYSFFKLLNVCILLLTAIVGLRFLTSGMRALNVHQEQAELTATAAAAPAPVSAPPAPPAIPATAEPAEENRELVGAVPAQAAQAAPGSAPSVAVTGNGATSGYLPPPPPGYPPHPMAGYPAPPQFRPVQPRGVAEAATRRPASMSLLYIWILLFGFVGTQLAWTLRPFFGDPGKPFALFRHIEGTFYADIIRTIGHLLGA
jgi:hypothetical protein